MIEYMGSKRVLVPLIERVAGRLPIASACDLVAGTTRVGQAMRRAGVRVIDRMAPDEPLRGAPLTGLVEAADRVDSACGLQMA